LVGGERGPNFAQQEQGRTYSQLEKSRKPSDEGRKRREDMQSCGELKIYLLQPRGGAKQKKDNSVSMHKKKHRSSRRRKRTRCGPRGRRLPISGAPLHKRQKNTENESSKAINYRCPGSLTEEKRIRDRGNNSKLLPRDQNETTRLLKRKNDEPLTGDSVFL